MLGADPLAIADAVDSLKGRYDWLHLDIMDGHFVRNLSFGPAVARALAKRWPGAFIDAHLMVDRLEVILPLFLDSGVSLITLHAETQPQLLHASLTEIRKAGLQAGAAVGPATPVSVLEPVLDILDLVLVMSVTPGFGGQSLIESTLDKTRSLVSLRAARGYRYRIQMDGGIKTENVAQVALAGCDVVVAGSGVFRSPDPAGCIDEMREQVKEALADGRNGTR